MDYSSIQVTPRMRRRLARYKLPGMSYEDVLSGLTDMIPPEEFKARQRQARVAARVAARAPGAASDAAREAEAARLARLTAGERMDEAYRLFAAVRGRA